MTAVNSDHERTGLGGQQGIALNFALLSRRDPPVRRGAQIAGQIKRRISVQTVTQLGSWRPLDRVHGNGFPIFVSLTQ